ncbi:hypothetical protein [Elizabethkingia argenteiflava]|nr:hypothetical protein [Elizabethkingia argenteiflava]
MKIIAQIISFFVFIAGLSTSRAQIQNNFHSENKYPKKEDRMNNYFSARMAILKESLGLSEEQKAPFSQIYSDYEESQMFVIREYKEKFGRKDLSQEETRERIYRGFDVSQKLLNNKRTYADRFLKVLTPKQLEKMFEMEKRMGKKIMRKK